MSKTALYRWQQIETQVQAVPNVSLSSPSITAQNPIAHVLFVVSLMDTIVT